MAAEQKQPSGIAPDRRFPAQTDKLSAWPAYLFGKGPAPTLVQNMLIQASRFFKHIDLSFRKAGKLKPEDLTKIQNKFKRIAEVRQKKSDSIEHLCP